MLSLIQLRNFISRNNFLYQLDLILDMKLTYNATTTRLWDLCRRKPQSSPQNCDTLIFINTGYDKRFRPLESILHRCQQAKCQWMGSRRLSQDRNMRNLFSN